MKVRTPISSYVWLELHRQTPYIRQQNMIIVLYLGMLKYRLYNNEYWIILDNVRNAIQYNSPATLTNSYFYEADHIQFLEDRGVGLTLITLRLQLEVMLYLMFCL